jgi:hypothetical protein
MPLSKKAGRPANKTNLVKIRYPALLDVSAVILQTV